LKTWAWRQSLIRFLGGREWTYGLRFDVGAYDLHWIGVEGDAAGCVDQLRLVSSAEHIAKGVRRCALLPGQNQAFSFENLRQEKCTTDLDVWANGSGSFCKETSYDGLIA